MSKNRWVNTRFWEDNYIIDLDPSEKLLFLYCLTNDKTALCGAYEINIKKICLETGFDREMVLKIFERFKKDGKIAYVDGYIVVRNYRKHQADNDKIRSGVEREENELPKHIKDSLSIGFDSLSNTTNTLPKPKPKPILNLNSITSNVDENEIETNSSTDEEKQMRELWKTHALTLLRNHVPENLKAYRYLLKELGEDLPQYIQAVRMIRADQYQPRKLQAKLINFVGLRDKLEEVEAYMQGKTDSDFIVNKPKISTYG